MVSIIVACDPLLLWHLVSFQTPELRRLVPAYCSAPFQMAEIIQFRAMPQAELYPHSRFFALPSVAR